MAQQYYNPEGSSASAEALEQQQQGQRSRGESTSSPNAPASDVLEQFLQPRVRSSPIAIVRSNSASSDDSNAEGGHSSDDDNDSDDERYSMQQLASTLPTTLEGGETTSNKKMSQSLLLRAPLLGSVPTRDELNLRYQNMLPPPHQIGSSAPAQPTVVASYSAGSYGSLRESQMHGTFMDGPASYRERGTGKIRPMAPGATSHRVRFRDATAGTSNNTLMLSIGERMMRARKIQQLNSKSLQKKRGSAGDSKQNGASGLTAMMQKQEAEGTASVSNIQQPPASEPALQQKTFYEDEFRLEPAGDAQQQQGVESGGPLYSQLLSTSLTGLELLQQTSKSGGRLTLLPPITASPMQLPMQGPSSETDDEEEFLLSSLEQIPRDPVTGNSTLVARSFSDPITQNNWRRDVVASALASPSLTSAIATAPTATKQPDMSPIPLGAMPPAAANARPTQSLSSTFRQQGDSEDLHRHDHPNPDTEATFDMEL